LAEKYPFQDPDYMQEMAEFDPDKDLTAEQRAEKFPFEDAAFMAQLRAEAPPPAPADTAAGEPSAAPPVSSPTAEAPQGLTLTEPSLERPDGSGSVSDAAPDQPEVGTADKAMPLVTGTTEPKAAVRWGGKAAQPLPFEGTPAERLRTMMDNARNGTLTKAMIDANKDLFGTDELKRLKGVFLSEMGTAHNGGTREGSRTAAALEKAVDQAIGYGHKGAITPAMRAAMLPQAARNLLAARDALKADPSEATLQAFQDARRAYEDLKYGDLMVDGHLNATGLLHLLGAEMKQALEPMELIDPETGKRQGDVIAQLFGAVEFARNTAEAAQREGKAARDHRNMVGKIAAMVRQAEADAGVYGVGPRGGRS
jgi:hypothetical protein